MGIVDGRRHQFRCFLGGKAEHDALIAGTFVLVAARIYPLRDVRRLFMQQVGDFAGGVMELVLLVADVLDAGARDLVDPPHVFRIRAGVAKRYSRCHARFGFLRQQGIEDRVGYPVAHFIRMALGHGFRGKHIIFTGHCSLQWK